jgi:light-regulated signal transduction histidine kinase (bacteriophytochrome)
MNPETLAKLRDCCTNEAAFVQLQQTLAQEFQPLQREIDGAQFQIEQQKALLRVVTRLREPLDLEAIFHATAVEVRQLLAADRVGMFRFYADSGWDDGEFVSEDVDPAFPSAMVQKVHDHCFGDQFAVHYQQGRVQAVADIYAAGLSPCHIDVLARFQVRANLIVPLIQGQKLWGLLCIHQCSKPRQWQSIEIEFVNHIAGHLGVALQQAELLADLRSEIAERQQAQQQAQSLNKGLRQAILELKAVNHELEAFSYSVSHDLRAPLRSIDGFSQALLEDYDTQLDGPGQDFLRRIRAATQRMGNLIDDLLTLSRVTRTSIKMESVNLSQIASDIASELQQSQPERQVAFEIEPDLQVRGDAHLLQVVLENLLNNAWKFTSKNPQAKIELGSIDSAERTLLDRDNGIPTYFVKDDGVGFDLAYVDKLFSPFQRLHGMQDFPGNGIGLATVQRIIHRHGGRVWADGGLGEGATFYFTLDDEAVEI